MSVPEPYATEIAPGVHAYVQPNGSWFLDNAGIIVGRDGVVLIDQCGTEARARRLLATVADLAGDRPVRTLVNTHHHADHTFGNFTLPAGTTIVAHERARVEQLATGTAITAFFEGPAWGDIEVRPPSLTFTDEVTIWVDETPIVLRHFGTPAHTTNDVVAWLPDRGVLFAGDLLFVGGAPFALQGSVVGWLETLPRLAELKARTIVPGHGRLSDGEAIDAVRGYLELVIEAAQRGLDAGMEPLELARDLDLGPFAGLLDGERIVGNLHRAYADLRGEPRGVPLDLPGIVAEMVAYKGGPIRSHA